MLPERFTSRRDTVIFAVCLVISLAARAAPDAVSESVARAVRTTILAPFLALQEQAELLRSSRARFEAVVAERDSAAQAAQDIVALEEENARLRALLQLGDRIPIKHVAAEVLHQAFPTDGLTLLLSAGSRDGVKPLSPVITPQGLLGVVRSVDPGRSVAIIWPHPDFRASAMTLDGSIYGIVTPEGVGGPNTMMLELTGVPYREHVPPGTPLYTSGFGGVYPRGIPIGWVTRVAEEQEGWARTYLVRPAVHPASVDHVIILLEPAADLGGAYKGGTP